MSDQERGELLATAWPPAPLPADYDDDEALKDLLAHLHAALCLAPAVTCARGGASGQLPPQILGSP